MFSNGRSKKTLVLTVVCLGLSVYLFGVIAIAQTTDKNEKVVLTPDDMSQIIGGWCDFCKKKPGYWQGSGCSWVSCTSSSECSPSTAEWYKPSDLCWSTVDKKVCTYGDNVGRRNYYNCECKSATIQPGGAQAPKLCRAVYDHAEGLSYTCSDTKTNSC